MHKPYYGAYIYKFGTGFVGIRFGTGKGISTWEPINDRLHEDFINNYSFMNVYGTLQKIKGEWNAYASDGMSEVKIREHYLDLLLKYHMSHMSICIHNYHYEDRNRPFICRLDCLTKEQFYYMLQALEYETMYNMDVWSCKLGDVEKFAWKGV